MYNIPVISMEWNKQILITYTLIHLCKKGKKRKMNVPSTGKYFKGRLFFAELTPFISIQCYILHTEMDFNEQK